MSSHVFFLCVAKSSPRSAKKPPPGAVPLFAGNLFGTVDEDDEPSEEAAVEKAPVVKDTSSREKRGGGGGLFDASEEDDDNDIFNTAPKSNATKAPGAVCLSSCLCIFISRCLKYIDINYIF